MMMQRLLLWCGVLFGGGWALVVEAAFSPSGHHPYPSRESCKTTTNPPTSTITSRPRRGNVLPLFLAFLDWKQGSSSSSSSLPHNNDPFAFLNLELPFLDTWPWKKEENHETIADKNDAHDETKQDYYAKAIELSQAVRNGIPQQVNGIFQIASEDQYHNFMKANSDKLVILSITSPYCRACRELKEKFRTLRQQDPKHFSSTGSSDRGGEVGGGEEEEDVVVLGDVVVSNNPHVDDPFRDFVTFQLGVVQIPSIRFYANSEEVGRTNCNPSTGCSWKTIKSKMIQFVQDYEGFVRVVYHSSSSSSSSSSSTPPPPPPQPQPQQQHDPLLSTTTTKATATASESLIGCDGEMETAAITDPAITDPDSLTTTAAAAAAAAATTTTTAASSTSAPAHLSVLSADEQRIVDAVLSIDTNTNDSGGDGDESMLDAILQAVKTPPAPNEETISTTMTSVKEGGGIPLGKVVIPMQAILDDLKKELGSSAAASVKFKEEEEEEDQQGQQQQHQNVALQVQQKLSREVGRKVKKVKPRQPKLQDEISDWLHRYFNG